MNSLRIIFSILVASTFAFVGDMQAMKWEHTKSTSNKSECERCYGRPVGENPFGRYLLVAAARKQADKHCDSAAKRVLAGTAINSAVMASKLTGETRKNLVLYTASNAVARAVAERSAAAGYGVTEFIKKSYDKYMPEGEFKDAVGEVATTLAPVAEERVYDHFAKGVVAVVNFFF